MRGDSCGELKGIARTFFSSPCENRSRCVLVDDLPGNPGQWKTVVCRWHDPGGVQGDGKHCRLKRRHSSKLRACRRRPNRKSINIRPGKLGTERPPVFPNERRLVNVRSVAIRSDNLQVIDGQISPGASRDSLKRWGQDGGLTC